MDVYEIRRLNLDVLAAEAGSLEAIGKAMLAAQKTPPTDAGKGFANYLSQIRGGRNMGSQFARDLEEGMGKPKGWMDTLHSIDQTMEQKEAAQLVMSLDPEDKELWMQMGRSMNRKGKRGPGNPFGDAPKDKTGTQ